jgi:hypothetical protein
MRYDRYCAVLLLVAGVCAAPIWPITVETVGYNARRTTCLVPFWYSRYGWITSMPPGWLIKISPIQPDQRSG